MSADCGLRIADWRRGRSRLMGFLLACVLLVAVQGLVLTASAAPAEPLSIRNPQSAIRIQSQSVKPEFPNKITFSLTAESDGADITAAQLFYRPTASEVSNLSAAEVKPGKKITLSLPVDMRTRYLPPGLNIQYYW